jgi:hypothetical protein
MLGLQRRPRRSDIFRLVNSMQHDVMPGGRKAFGNRVAEARGRAGDQR